MRRKIRKILLCVAGAFLILVGLSCWQFRRLFGFFPSKELVAQVVDVSDLPSYRAVSTSSLGNSLDVHLLCDNTGKTVSISKTTGYQGIDLVDYGDENVDKSFEFLKKGMIMPETPSGGERFTDFRETSRSVIFAQGEAFPILCGTCRDDTASSLICVSSVRVGRGGKVLELQVTWLSPRDEFSAREMRQLLDALSIE